MGIRAIEIDEDGTSDDLEVTMRGTPSAIVSALFNGLSRDALIQIRDAMGVELEKRFDVATGRASSKS